MRQKDKQTDDGCGATLYAVCWRNGAITVPEKCCVSSVVIG